MLSEMHQNILAAIAETIDIKGYPPSVRELGQQLNIKSTSTVHKYLNDLEDANYIVRENMKNRSIRLVNQESDKRTNSLHVPLLGKVAAGAPILAVEQKDEYIVFETPKYKKEELFALQVKGDSMIEVGIFNGDYIVAKRTPTADNGDIIVALIDDEATVKTFYRENGVYRLQPENSSMEPIIVDHMYVLGRVIAVLRYMD